jgi:hypothetical protein
MRDDGEICEIFVRLALDIEPGFIALGVGALSMMLVRPREADAAVDAAAVADRLQARQHMHMFFCHLERVMMHLSKHALHPCERPISQPIFNLESVFKEEVDIGLTKFLRSIYQEMRSMRVINTKRETDLRQPLCAYSIPKLYPRE